MKKIIGAQPGTTPRSGANFCLAFLIFLKDPNYIQIFLKDRKMDVDGKDIYSHNVICDGKLN